MTFVGERHICLLPDEVGDNSLNCIRESVGESDADCALFGVGSGDFVDPCGEEEKGEREERGQLGLQSSPSKEK